MPVTPAGSDADASLAVAEVQRLLRHHDGVEPLLVAVDGTDASRRTAVAAALAGSLGAVVVALDAFVRPMAADRRAALDAQTAYELLYDWQRLIEEVLDPLVLGEPGAYRRFDHTSGDLGGEPVVVAARGRVVVEGRFVLRPQLRGYFDIAVHLEGGASDEADAWYLDHVAASAGADVVVPLSR